MLDLVLSRETEKDGSCMFDAIHDQIQHIPELKNYAHSHWELRWKLVSEGYDKFLVTGKLLLGQGTAEDWKRKMSNPTEYGDEVVLNLACNLLSVTIIIIPAFKESGHNSGLGITFIKALNKPKHPPIFLFYYPENISD